MLVLSDIEADLLTLPYYRDLDAGREALEFRLAVCYLAALQDATFWKIKAFTNYPDRVIEVAVKKMEDNDAIKAGKATESFARNFVRGGSALVARVVASMGTAIPEKSPIPSRGKAAAIRAAIETLCETQNGTGFNIHDIAAHLQQQGIEGVQGDIGTQLLNLRKSGALRCIQEGVTGAPARYVKGDGQAPAPPVKPKSDIATDIILSHKEPFTLGVIRRIYIAQTSDSEEAATLVCIGAITKLIKAGKIKVVNMKDSWGGDKVYAPADGEIDTESEPAPIAEPALITPTELATIPSPVTEQLAPLAFPVSPSVTELLPGPEERPRDRLIQILQEVRIEMISEVETIDRAIGILERRITR